jgi:signal transduction histidine kinase
LAVTSGVERNDELGEAARAFDDMIERLAAAEAAGKAAESERRALIAAVGHDLRTPLASLQATVEALQDGIAPDPARYLRGMATDIDHLHRLVDDLFLLARLDAGSHRVDPEPVDLAELADEAVEALTPMANAQEVTLTTRAAGPVPAVADPAAVGRVLRNLVHNAVRHGGAGGEVTVLVSSDPHAPVIEVIDQGPGFPPEYRSKAFERFVRVEGSRSRADGGAGLGLAIAKELVELSGGTIALGDGPGGRVRVTLPAV